MKMPGLYVRQPYADAIVTGLKRTETRGYPIPEKHLGKWAAVIATGNPDGRKSYVAGLVWLSGWHLYCNKQDWMSDQANHLISSGNMRYGWETTLCKYGWRLRFAAQLPADADITIHKGGRVWTTIDIDHRLFLEATGRPLTSALDAIDRRTEQCV